MRKRHNKRRKFTGKRITRKQALNGLGDPAKWKEEEEKLGKLQFSMDYDFQKSEVSILSYLEHPRQAIIVQNVM